MTDPLAAILADALPKAHANLGPGLCRLDPDRLAAAIRADPRTVEWLAERLPSVLIDWDPGDPEWLRAAAAILALGALQ